MPFEQNDPAAWWRGAEPLPPKPDEPGEWVPGATPYGWAWKRAEGPAPDAAAAAIEAAAQSTSSPFGASFAESVTSGLRRGPAFWELPAAPVPEVRVGDRVRPAHDVARRVERVEAGLAFLETLGSGVTPHPVELSDIGPAGSGKPWLLMPRDPVPDDAVPSCIPREPAPWQVRPPTFPPEVRVGDRLHHRYGNKPWNVREVAHGFARVECDGVEVSAGLHNIGLDGYSKLWTLLPREADPACDAPVGGLLSTTEFVEGEGDTGTGDAVVVRAVTAEPPRRVLWSRVLAACAAHERAAPKGEVAAMIDALRAADAVPDPRREAERRVVEAARDATNPCPGGLGEAYVRLCGVLRALAALDGERGPP